MRPLKTGVGWFGLRGGSIATIPATAQQLAANGIDYFFVSDQINSYLPRSLWSPEFTAFSDVDNDSWYDWRISAALAANAAPGLGVQVGGTDAIRNGPAELTVTMLTLAELSQGNAICCVGAGENYHVTPFGYNRKEGVGRLGDMLELTRMYLDADGPIDYDGKYWHVRGATIGSTRQYRPEFWAMGGGPKLIETACRFADGLITGVPAAMTNIDRYAEMVQKVKARLAELDRDPEAFGFGIMSSVLCHEDPDTLEDTIKTNPLVKFGSSWWGRFRQSDWLDEGIEPVWPRDWHYALNLLSATMSRDECMDVCDRVPPEMVTKGNLCGSPAELAEQYIPFVEAGANFIEPFDCAAVALEPEDAMKSTDRMIQAMQILKERCGAPAATAPS